MNLQELIEHGIVTKIETDETPLGYGYKVYVHLRNYSIGSVIIDVGIDEYLTDAITLINKMVEVDNALDAKSPEENLKDLFEEDIVKNIANGDME